MQAKKNRTPQTNKTLRWTAGEMLHLVTSSVELMGQLMTSTQKQHTVWKAWVAHVNYFMQLMQMSFTVDELGDLRKKIVDAHQLFLSVSEFQKLWSPKHHYSLHFVTDILRFGPPRFYWCMRFESKNKEHKNAAKTGNFRDVPGTIVQFWCRRSAIKLLRGTHGPRNSIITAAASSFLASEPFSLKSCLEHDAAYSMLGGHLTSKHTVTWIKEIRTCGIQIYRNSWILVQDTHDGQSWCAQVETLFHISHKASPEDRCFFASTHACLFSSDMVHQNFGTWSIQNHKLHEGLTETVFPCAHVAISELICHQCDGVYTFILSP